MSLVLLCLAARLTTVSLNSDITVFFYAIHISSTKIAILPSPNDVPKKLLQHCYIKTIQNIIIIIIIIDYSVMMNLIAT